MPLIAPLKQNTGILSEPRVNSSEHLQNRRFANPQVVRVSHTDKQVHKSASVVKFSRMTTPASESSMQPPQPDSSPFSQPECLNTIEADCWNVLSESVSRRDHGWRLPALATYAAGQIRQRTVVLRSVDRTTRTLFFHTDLRSPKVAALRENPNASLLFYDAASSVQLLLQGRVTLHTDSELADDLWQNGPPESLRSYLAPNAPGAVSAEPTDNLPPDVRGRIPDRSELEPGRSQFMVLEVHVSEAEWLLLARSGNRRARFIYQEAGDPLREWCCP
jgi:hypothetical protein